MSKKILLIDDDPRLVEVLQIRLEAAGYGVHVAFNGQDGVATARNVLPALIVLDVNMPGMDGLEVCRTLREADRLSLTPIIIMSAVTHQLARRAAFDAGATRFVAKPYQAGQVMEAIRQAIDGRSAA
jgi:two-component system, OmpR family, alkaline phosphatase synthesis response regulator PhoP